VRPSPAVRLPAAVLAVVVGGWTACSRGARPAAELIVTHARIWTGDPVHPEASALAVIGERIVDVGADDRIDAWRGADTRVIDAAGRRVVAGFNDAHVHIVDAGTAIEQIDLGDAVDAGEIVRRIAERARANPGDWIAGGRWSARFAAVDLPTRSALDDVTNGSPVFVVDADRRRALVNSAAFGRAGITEQTPDPPDGRIVRDARGLPTGLVEGAALALVERAVPRPTPADRVRAVKRALERAASLGVTSVQDIGASGEDVAAFAELAGRDELAARVYAVPDEAGWYDQAKLGIRHAFGSTWLRLGAVIAATGTGGDLHAADLLRTRLMAADHAGLQVCMSARGEGGAAEALDRLDDIVRADGSRDRRFRVEHAERATPADARRFASLQAVASLLPGAQTAAAFDALTKERVRVALGTGWPDSTIDPMPMLQLIAALAPTADAIAAYTAGSAFAEFQDTETGILVRGRLADFVIVSDDLVSVPRARIAGVQALTTVVGGKIVHRRRP